LLNLPTKKIEKMRILIVLSSLCIASCNSTENNTVKMTESNPTLAEQLNEKKANFEQKADDSKKMDYAEGIAAVAESGILEMAFKIGDKAPDFMLLNANAVKVSLYSELEKGPVVLTWYRGGWCPYCNITLNQLQKDLPKFKSLGTTILALTPELPDSSLSTKEKNSLEFEVLTDLENKVGKTFGVVYELTAAVAKRYQEGFGLHQYNADSSNELPLAATYVIAQDGTIKYAFLDADYRNRAEPSEILDALKAL